MDRPIRILHVLQRMEAGGTQALLMNLYRNIDRTKIQFDFFVEYPDKQFYDDEIESMGGHIYYNSVRKDFNMLKFQKELKRVLKNHPEYRIIHVHAYTVGYFVLKVAHEFGVPVRIAHSHNNATVRDNKYYLKLIMQKLYTIHATDFFACSEEAGTYLFKGKKFKVLKNAIDSEKFIADKKVGEKVRKELNIAPDAFVVGHVGRLHAQKNHEFLLKVFKEIKKRKSNACLLLVGTGPLEHQIKEQVKTLGLEDTVLFLGNRSDMYRIYQAMDVFILPSLFEGLGIVAIEAQAAGIPVLCSEGVSKDANVSPIFHAKSLDASPVEWATQAIEVSNDKMAHTNTQKYIIEAGYDVKTTAKDMQEYYLRKYRER